MVTDKLSCTTVLVACTICCCREVVATPWSWIELEEPSTGVLVSMSLTIVADGVDVEGTIAEV